MFDAQGVPERIRRVHHGRQDCGKPRRRALRMNSGKEGGVRWSPILHSRSDSSGLGGLVPGGISRSRELPHLSGPSEA